MEDSERQAFETIFDKMRFVVSDCDETDVYANYRNANGYFEFRSIHDKKFKVFVRESYRKIVSEDDVPNFSSVLQVYEDKAISSAQAVPILQRLGGSEDEMVYFTADKKNTVIAVDKNGIRRLKRRNGYYFLRRANTKAQVSYKLRDKSLLDELKPFLNMDRHMQVLFTTILVQSFLCSSSHFLGVISSRQGSGKTTFTNLIRQIIDPAIAPQTTIPDNADSLKNQLSNNFMVCYDNTTTLSTEFSNILCGAVTGSASSKRKLYTNNDEVIIKFHNVVFLNGIDVIPTKSDLLERSILFKLNTIPPEKRKSEADLKRKFNASLPYILGAVFKTLQGYFQIKDSTDVEGNHRMSGAYRDCYIIATVIGVQDEFLEAFKENQKLLLEDLADTNPVISAIKNFMISNGAVKITKPVAELYEKIKQCSDNPQFPKSASAFSRKIGNQEEELRKIGYKVVFNSKHDYTELTIAKNRRKS